MSQFNQLYPQVTDNQSDAFAWVFNGPNQEAVKYAFNFPELKDDEVRVKVTYVGLSQQDGISLNQQYEKKKKKKVELVNSVNNTSQIVAGHECVGRLIAKGSEVHGLKVGDLVGFGSIKNDSKEFQLGSFATHVQGSARWAFPIPASIPEEKVAPLLYSGLSAFSALTKYAKVGKELAIIGVNDIGNLAIEFAVKMGLKVTVVSGEADKREEVLALGANEFVLSSDDKSINMNFGRFEFVLVAEQVYSSGQFESWINMVKAEGDIVKVGLSGSSTPLSISFAGLIFFNRKLSGSYAGSRQDHFNALEFAARNKVFPRVEVFQFEEFNKAFTQFSQGKVRYNCVLKV